MSAGMPCFKINKLEFHEREREREKERERAFL